MNQRTDVRIVDIPEAWQKNMGSGKMVIVSPAHFRDALKLVPKGYVVTLSELRRKFAADYQVKGTCPLTSGIFLRIVGEAAEEARDEGCLEDVTPYWRVVRDDGSMFGKFPVGSVGQAELLASEGIDVFMHKRKLSVNLNQVPVFHF